MIKEELIRRILDEIDICERRNKVTHTDFLRKEELDDAENFVMRRGVPYLFTGGYEGAEKQAIFFIPSWMAPEEVDLSEYLTAVEILPADKKEHPHGDYLGSLMALGMQRMKMGDVIALPDKGYVICFPEIARMICRELIRLGRTSCSCREVKTDEIPGVRHETENTTESVPSLRADVVAGAAFHLSRKAVSEHISRGDLVVGSETVMKDDKILTPPCTMSMRGFGRVEFDAVAGTTRKGRILISIQKRK